MFLKFKKRNNEINFVSILFLFPSFLIISLFIFYPIVDSFLLSLYSWNGMDPVKTFIGLNNWKNLIFDLRFWGSLKNNIIILVLSIMIQIPMGIFLALALDYVGKKFNFLRSIYYLPMLISSVAIGFLFRYAYDPQFGIVAGILNIFKITVPIDILGNPKYSIFAIIGVICWQFIPFYFILFVAAISSVPVELYEAAKIDGASAIQTFFKITVPLLKPTILLTAIMSTNGTLQLFDESINLTDGGPANASISMSHYIYNLCFK